MKKILVTMYLGILITAVQGQTNQVQVNSSNIIIGQGNPDANYKVTLQNNSSLPHSVYINNITSGATGINEALRAYNPAGKNYDIAIRSMASYSTPLSKSRSYGMYVSAGNATTRYNYGIFSFITGSNDGTAIFGMSQSGLSEEIVGGRFAGYFMGRVYMSERLGIGQNSPSYTLDVNGTIRCTTLTQTSDLRTKTNVTELGGTLGQVGKLRAVKYNLMEEPLPPAKTTAPDTGKVITDMRKYLALEEKKDADRKHIGFIAQEVKTVFPELVYEDEKGMLSIDYLSLIPVLVETIQELNRRLEAVENRQSTGIVK